MMKRSMRTLLLVSWIMTLLTPSAAPAFTRSGWVTCWGGYCPSVPEPNVDFVVVAAGAWHNMGLKADGTIIEWNQGGQFEVPAPNADFVGLAAGSPLSIGVKSDGTIVTWKGDAPPEPNLGFIAAAAGDLHYLGLRSDGSIVAWQANVGGNDYGQCDVPPPNADFVAVAAGAYHSLGLKADGSIVAWGRNDSGQANAPSGSDFVAIAAGYVHSLALRVDGTLAAWGDNTFQQCDVPMPPHPGFLTVACGRMHSLAIATDGSVWAWGRNDEGQCSVPEPNSGFIAIAGGETFSLGLRSSGPLLLEANVSTEGSDMLGDGTPEHPFRTIRRALLSTASGGEVVIACGVYRENALRLRSGVSLRSETGKADCVTIDARVSQERGLYCLDIGGDVTVKGITITGGEAAASSEYDQYGGGMYCEDCDATFENCRFAYNDAQGGGAACLRNSSPSFVRTVFEHNSAGGGGGLLCENNSAPRISYCAFYNNSASFGGAIYGATAAFPAILLCTFVDNWGAVVGPAIFGEGFTLANSIVAFHTSDMSEGPISGNATLTCCDVFGNAGGDYVGAIANQASINGNICADPLFVNPSAADYRLADGSPCRTGGACGTIGCPLEAPTVSLPVLVRSLGAGTPLAGATVVLQQQNGWICSSVSTGQSGSCAFTSLQAGTAYVLKASYGDFASDVAVVVAGANKSAPILEVPVNYEIRGLVRDELNGLPIVGALVEMVRNGSPIASKTTGEKRLDAQSGDYNFRMSTETAGAITLRVSYKKMIGSKYPELQNLYHPNEFTITLGSTGSVFNVGSIDLVTNVVLLLHGVQSSSEIWERSATDYVTSLHNDGWAVYDNINLGYSRTPWRHLTERRYGFDKIATLSDQVVRLVENLGVQSCNAIAHSAGGLVARWYNETGSVPKLRTLITLGTPHHGSRTAEWADFQKNAYADCWGKSASACAPIIDEVMPESALLRTLNQNNNCPEHLPYCDWWQGGCSGAPNPEVRLQARTSYWAVQGTRGSGSGGSFVNAAGGCSANDGVVPTLSAMIWGIDSSHNKQVSCSHYPEKDNVGLYDSTDLRDWVRARLNGVPLLPSLAASAGKRSGAGLWAEINTADAVVAPDTTTVSEFSVETCDTLHVACSWVRQAVAFTLLSPQGVLVDSLSAALNDSVQYTTTDDGDGRWYDIANPAAGVWQCRFVSPAGIDTHSTRVSAWGYGCLGMVCSIAAAVTSGEVTTVLMATITTPETAPVMSASVNAVVVRPDATSYSLPLSDNGIAPDVIANDGVYTAVFPGGGPYGGCEIVVEASGSDPFTFLRRQKLIHEFRPYADVMIESGEVTVQSENGLVGSPVAISTIVRNNGAIPAMVAMAITDEATARTVLNDTMLVTSGGQVALSGIDTPLSEGAHRYRASAWPTDEVIDPVGANNRAEAVIAIGGFVTGVLEGDEGGNERHFPQPGSAGHLALTGTFPNPFNPSIGVSFAVEGRVPISLEVFDLRGRRIASLLRHGGFSGGGFVRWDGHDEEGRLVGSGVYIVRLSGAGMQDHAKVLLVR